MHKKIVIYKKEFRVENVNTFLIVEKMVEL